MPISLPATSIVNSALPGSNGLTKSATDIVNQLLSGLPGTSNSRRQGAYLGAASGMPGSNYAANRGFDIYNRKSQENQQTGIKDLLDLISGYSQPYLTGRGQDFGNQQASNALAQKTANDAAQLALQKSKIDFAGRPEYAGGGYGGGPPFYGPVGSNGRPLSQTQIPSPSGWY